MVTFRFYLVSLVAVFLALAMGVVVGSTLIDRAIVDRLENSVDRVGARADRVQDQNDDLEQQLAELREFGELTDDAAVAGTLDGSSVVVVAERGVDSDPVRATVSLLAAAGAESPGVLWLEPGWVLEEEGQVNAMASAINVPVTDAAGLRDRAWRRVVDELQGASVTGEPLGELGADGFLTFDAVEEGADLDDLSGVLEDQPGVAEHAVLVTGPTSQLGGGLTVDMGRVLVDGDIGTVVAEAWRDDEEGPARGAAIQPVRDAEDLAELVATVDDLDLVQGRVATVWAAAQDRPQGAYGYGPDVEGPLPDRPARPAP